MRWLDGITDMINRSSEQAPGVGDGQGSLGEGNGNQTQYSCLENPMDSGAWWATVHGVTKSWTQVKQLSTAQHSYGYLY